MRLRKLAKLNAIIRLTQLGRASDVTVPRVERDADLNPLVTIGASHFVPRTDAVEPVACGARGRTRTDEGATLGSPSGRRDQMTFCIGRREFITLLGAAAAWPLAARAQQRALRVVGYLSGREANDNLEAAFHLGLKEAGFVEGQNVRLEYRWAQGQYDRLPALVAELLRHPVDVLVTTGGTLSALAAKAATTTIPIVFVTGSDPIKFGLVASLNRPGGNATGVSFLVNALTAKQFELLHEMVPKAKLIGFLANPINPNTGPTQETYVRPRTRSGCCSMS